jgi:hypothetical protein
MAMHVLHIASGLFFWICASLSLCILEPQTIFECFINREQFIQEEGKQKLKSNSYLNSSLMKGFGAFVNFASSTGNQTTALWSKSCPVSEKQIGCQARPQPNFGDIFN